MPAGLRNLRFLFALAQLTRTMPRLDNRVGRAPEREGYPGRRAMRLAVEENCIT
jgi:hypothetical protein